ncbi:MAG: ECF-type sigma factor [Gemmatales bacterium]
MSGIEDSSEHQITALLQAVQAGDPRAASQILAFTYQDVHSIARMVLRNERPGHTLTPTALVNEVSQYFLQSDILTRLSDRNQYFAIVLKGMKHILIDYERRRSTLKAGGNFNRQPMRSSILAVQTSKSLSPLELLEVLERLAEKVPRASEVVTLHVLEGLTQKEVAERLDVSLATVESDWRFARAWLRRELS